MPNLFAFHKAFRLAGLVGGAAIVALLVLVLRGVSLPAPTGPYAVGRVTHRWLDESRPEPLTDAPGDHRAVIAHVWYPAQPTGAAKPAHYLPVWEVLRPALAASPEFGLFNAWAVGLVRAHARPEAPPARTDGAFPVLLFLPGNRTNAGLYAVLLEDLASHGYVVAAIDHPYDVEAVLLPNGQVARFSAATWPAPEASMVVETEPHAEIYRQRVEVRAQDAVFVLNHLAQLPGEALLAGQLDLTRVGIFGHSVGGVAAPRACQLDARFGACLNLDGLTAGMPFYLAADGRGLSQPFLMLTKPSDLPAPSDADLAHWGLSRAAWEAGAARAAAQQAERFRAATGGSYRLTLSGAAHDSFTDAPLLMPAWLNARQPEAARHAEIARHYARAFFDHYLLADTGVALSPLARYEEVSFEVFVP